MTTDIAIHTEEVNRGDGSVPLFSLGIIHRHTAVALGWHRLRLAKGQET